eukprot:5485752-Prymnesium_polylepis.1
MCLAARPRTGRGRSSPVSATVAQVPVAQVSSGGHVPVLVAEKDSFKCSSMSNVCALALVVTA